MKSQCCKLLSVFTIKFTTFFRKIWKNLFLSLKQNEFPQSNIWKNKECFLIMISSCLELRLIIITYLSCKLIFHNILWFVLNLSFCTEERLPPHLVRSASKDISKVSSVETPQECYEPKNKRKCTEPEMERVRNDLIELNDTELNYMYFDYKTDSGDASNNSDEDFVLQKAYFILNSLV